MRQPAPTPNDIETVIVGDMAQAIDWSAALRDVDCVIHAAGRAHQTAGADAQDHAAFRRTNVDATLALAEQTAAAGVRRFIFVSSAHVNGGATHGRGFRSDDTPQPTGPYAQSKLDAERGLAEIARRTKLEMVVLRPPLIAGLGVKGNLETLYGAIRRGWLLPFGSIDRNRRDLVSCETLSDLIHVCIDHDQAAGQTFMVSDGRPLSTRALVQAMADEIGVRPNLWPIPEGLLRLMLKAAGRGRMASQLTEDLEIDISHTCQRLNWTPPTAAADIER
jgi:nucleoside-diphosphate-sugar epimerase